MRVVLDADILSEGAPCREELVRRARPFTLACLAAGVLGTAAFGLVGGLPAGWGGWLDLALVVGVGSLAALPLHELVHAALFKLLGPRGATRVRFGYTGGMLWASCPGTRYARGAFLAVLLAPLVVLSCAFLIVALAVPLAWAPCAAWWLFVLHAAGCVGDLYFAELVWRHPEARACEDTERGMRLLADEDGE